MAMYLYIFKNKDTGETVRAESYAVNPAARLAGIYNELGITPPWIRWECWEGSECIWHYDENGESHSGSRK